MISKTKSKKIEVIREKLKDKLSTSEVIFLRNFCKKHWYFALYKALDFERLSMSK